MTIISKCIIIGKSVDHLIECATGSSMLYNSDLLDTELALGMLGRADDDDC